MTTILNTLELIPHNKVSYDFPNVHGDLERLYLDAVYALGGVEFLDNTLQVQRLKGFSIMPRTLNVPSLKEVSMYSMPCGA